MKRMMVFHASGVDSNSVGSHDAGTNLDLAAFDVADLQCMTGTEDTVELTFNETGIFNKHSNVGDATFTGTDVSVALENSPEHALHAPIGERHARSKSAE